MHPEILNNDQITLLPLIETFKKEFYLVGGTALALQLGHRASIDFDLFKETKINPARITKQIAAHNLSYRMIHKDTDQFHIWIQNVKLTFFEYSFKVPHPVWFEQIITMPTLLDLSAMKAYALGRRAKWKDYVDLFWLLKHHFTLIDISTRSQEIFGALFSEKLFREQLCYFKDIDYGEDVFFAKEPVNRSTIESFLSNVALQL